jgi:DNA-binding response OmpR family regulator
MRAPSPPPSDRDTIAELQDKVRQLEELLAPTDAAFPIRWKLTHLEMVLLSSLVVGPEGYRTKEALLHVLSENSPQGDVGQGQNHLQVHINNIRRKLKPWNIVIDTRYGLGFQLTIPSLTVLRALRKASTEALATLLAER